MSEDGCKVGYYVRKDGNGFEHRTVHVISMNDDDVNYKEGRSEYIYTKTTADIFFEKDEAIADASRRNALIKDAYEGTE